VSSTELPGGPFRARNVVSISKLLPSSIGFGQRLSEVLNKVTLSCMIGNALEWYDFVIYSYFASLLGNLFFPTSEPFAQMVATWCIFWAGFIARPLGSILFGHIGDRFSRKTALMVSIYVMAIPTALIGLLPTYAQIGPMAAVLLFILRTLQGLAIGGEFTGSMVFMVEHAKPHNRGFAGSFATFSLVAGVIVGSAVATGINTFLSIDAVTSWGWRVPFLLSILGSLVGSYMRTSLTDPTEYLAEKSKRKAHSTPLKDLFQHYKAKVMLVIGIDFLTAVGFFLIVIFLPTYFSRHLNLSPEKALWINTISMCLFSMFILMGGWLSDVFGRLWVLVLPCIAFIVLSYPLFCLFQLGQTVPVCIAAFMLVFMMGIYFGAIPAGLSEIFPTHVRFSGLSLGHNLSMTLFGGSTPLMASYLINYTQSDVSPAYLLIGSAFLTLFSLKFFRRETVSV
jgi:MHS family proline/betaine transporter-like MFS transporter